MNFQLNNNLGNWLAQLNGKTVDKIYQVDYNSDRHDDIYLPWLFFITFVDFEQFLEIEGDFDGEHIRIKLLPIADLPQKIQENDIPNDPDLWHVYNTESNEILGKLLKQKIDFIEYGIDKDHNEINGTIIKGEKDIFRFIRFNCHNLNLSIFEGVTTGLGISDDKNIKYNFEETFDIYNTRT